MISVIVFFICSNKKKYPLKYQYFNIIDLINIMLLDDFYHVLNCCFRGY